MYTHSPVGFFYDQRDGMGSMGFLGGLVYVPDLGAVGSGSAGTYYPRDTSQDAKALAYLGFYPEVAEHVGTLGSKDADMAASQGAWNPKFRTGLIAFQKRAGLFADGWIGPSSRKALAAAVAIANAADGQPPMPNVLPIPPPPPNPNLPNVVPGPSPGPQPVSAKTSGLSTMAKVGIGAGVLAAVGGLYYAFR